MKTLFIQCMNDTQILKENFPLLVELLSPGFCWVNGQRGSSKPPGPQLCKGPESPSTAHPGSVTCGASSVSGDFSLLTTNVITNNCPFWAAGNLAASEAVLRCQALPVQQEPWSCCADPAHGPPRQPPPAGGTLLSIPTASPGREGRALPAASAFNWNKKKKKKGNATRGC